MADKQIAASVTSNTEECFLIEGDSYLILADGRALVLRHATGAYWVATANDVAGQLAAVARRLKEDTAALANVLVLAGFV